MWYHYIVGVGAFMLLSAAWVVVQRAWKSSFADFGSDSDALAGRPGCGGCIDAEGCSGRERSEGCEAQEEMR
jgi:hypothetical protein